MCGIFGYCNYKTSCLKHEVVSKLINGLRRLEYRGYDSAGVCFDGLPGQAPVILKMNGNIDCLQKHIDEQGLDLDTPVNNHISIAHTRWATHGAPSIQNSHPQRSDEGGAFVVVHNGIITNFMAIKTMLLSKGFVFESETDTEVIPKLLKYLHDNMPGRVLFADLVRKAVKLLEGAFALIVKSSEFPGEVVACKRGSPLVVGVKGKLENSSGLPIEVQEMSSVTLSEVDKVGTAAYNGPTSPMAFNFANEIPPPSPAVEPLELFISSDISAIIEHTRRVMYIENNDIVHVNANGRISIVHVHDHDEEKDVQTPTTRELSTVEMELSEIMKGKFDYFMQKEIHEQPESTVNTMRGRINFEAGTVQLGGLVRHLTDMKRCRRLLFIACGTSYNACVSTRIIMEELTELPVTTELASDFNDRSCPIFRDDVCFFVSQSGETADTLEALMYAKAHGALCVGITNTVGSTIARESMCGVHINAGAEIGVASTKAFTSQIISIIMIALVLSQDSVSKQQRRKEILADLKRIPNLISQVLAKDDQVKEFAKQICQSNSLLVLGRGFQHGVCLEGALKIKEISYIHTEGIMAGELKHGPLALVDKSMPIILIATKDRTYAKVQNAKYQVHARAGKLMLICSEGDQEIQDGISPQFCFEVPTVVDCLQVLLNIIPLQLLSFHLAVARGFNVDQPRNLAKSVTVH